MIAGKEPASSLFEIRSLDPEGRRVWVGVRDPEHVDKVAAAVARLRDRHSVYIGAAPRVRERGTLADIERVWALWADCDTPQSAERLRAFHPLPSVVVRSGQPGRLHAYWPLREPVPPAWAKRGNRRLAFALGSDKAATDAARVLRPVGSINHKVEAVVTCAYVELDVFTISEVVGHLPDETPPASRREEAPRTTGATVNIEGLVQTVRHATPGPQRTDGGGINSTLYWAACRAREHIDAGELDPETAVQRLSQAAREAGLVEERRIISTLRSAFGEAA